MKLLDRAPILLLLSAITFVAGVAISAAAVFGDNSVDRRVAAEKAPSPRATLAPFGSCDGLRGYLRHHRAALGSPVTGVAEDMVPAEPGASTGGPAAPPPGGTNVQEQGVDEPDLVQAQGSTIFNVFGNRLRAIGTSGGAPAVLGSVQLPGASSAIADRELLVAGDQALVITRSYAGFGAAAGGPPPGATEPGAAELAPDLIGGPARTLLTEVEIADPTAMSVSRTLSVQGDYVSARLTGATARVVISAYPELPVARRGKDRAWMPATVLRDRAGDRTRGRLVDCRDVRRPRGFSGGEMLSVLTIDLERGLPAVDTDAVMTGGEIVYGSPTSLYVATQRRQAPDATTAGGSSVSTAIHRFDVTDPDSTEYVASGEVEGYMLSQWSMSELDGVLRVASTTAPPWGETGPVGHSESMVTTLALDGDRLIRVGRVDGLGLDEQIYAVRFIGELGYVVTFHQVDPLFVVDLSDPTAPRLAGELRIPGYSAYLHPVGPGLLLGVGQGATSGGRTTGLQASLFDVSDPAAPVRLDQVSLGRGSSSEVEYDHHAFTFSPEHGLAVIPLESWTDVDRTRVGAVGVHVDPAGTLTRTAETSLGSSYEAAIRRSLVLAGRVFTVSGTGIGAHDPATLERLAFTPFAGDSN